MSNDKHVHLFGGFIDAVENSPVADAVAQQASHFTFEAADITMPSRLALELREAADQLSREWSLRGGDKLLNLRRQDNLKHPY